MQTQRIGGDVVADVLVGRGVRTVFSLSGGALNWVLDALHRRNVSIIGSRHESATIMQADGYARASSSVGVAMVIAQQGLSNASGGLGAANEACTPIVVIVAVQPPWLSEDPGLLEDIDELAAARPFAKWVRTVRSKHMLPVLLEEAFRRAQAGRPGPVVLGIPLDMLAEGNDALPTAITTVHRPDANAEAVAGAAALLAAARRPLIIAGAGAYWSDAGEALRTLATEFGFPVVGDCAGRGLVPEDWSSGYSWPLAQPAAKFADVVLLVGARLNYRFNRGLPPRFAADAKFIQIDIHGDDIGRGRPIDVAVESDARAALLALIQRLRALGAPAPKDPRWVREAISPRLKRLDEIAIDSNGPLHPLQMARSLNRLMPANTLVVGDGADVLNWLHGALQVRNALGFMDYQPYGSMGVGTPMAVGAAAAVRDLAVSNGETARPVVLVTGDGSFGFYCAELNSAQQAGLPLVVIVSNDGGWGTERHSQRKAGMKQVINCDFGVARHDLVAQGFLCEGTQVSTIAAFESALAKAFHSHIPMLIDCVTDPAAGMLRKTDPHAEMVFYSDAIPK